MIYAFRDEASMSRAAAELFAREARRAVEEQGRFSVALSGGSTPLPAYRLLSDWDDEEGGIPWHGVHVFWGDERCVPPEDGRSNQFQARRAFLDRVPIPSQQIHPVSCNDSPAAAATMYEALLRRIFPEEGKSFDLVLLGLGQDGHTASLFPDQGPPEEGRWVVAVNRPGTEPERVSLTPAILNRAAKIAFLVGGEKKARVLNQVVEEAAGAEDLPARMIQPVEGELIWLVDSEAGRLLGP